MLQIRFQAKLRAMKKISAAMLLMTGFHGLVFAEILTQASGAAALSGNAAASGDLESARALAAVPFTPAAGDRAPVVTADAGVRAPEAAAPTAQGEAAPSKTQPPAPSRSSKGNRSGWSRLGQGLLGAGLIAGGVGLIVCASTLAFPIGIGLAAAGGAAMIYGMVAGDDRAGVGGIGVAAMGGFTLIPPIGGLALGPWYVGGMFVLAGAVLAYHALT